MSGSASIIPDPSAAKGPTLDSVLQNLQARTVGSKFISDIVVPLLKQRYEAETFTVSIENGYWPSCVEKADLLAAVVLKCMVEGFQDTVKRALFKGDRSDSLCNKLMDQDAEFFITMLMLLKSTESMRKTEKK
ncbi:hypothetical protein EJ02DRAFT_454288 [Clathrospora elynae]|uniref:Uncharacterized protein n=1 Tax=Clathrospora elynae TaxID=706981 RepID=A0A6A5SP74_9PLEO|nr:hypothetical protein EJ02DRAFT_454288 [Clathrospora elynae]